MRIALEQPISIEEIKLLIFESYGTKASGPGSMSFLFYQQFWLIFPRRFNFIS